MIDDVKRFLHQHHVPIEWLAIQSGLPVRTVTELLNGNRRMTPKYAVRFQRALAQKIG